MLKKFQKISNAVMTLRRLLLCQYSWATSIRTHKKLSKIKNKVSLSPKFLDAVKLWPKLLEEENEAQLEKINELIKAKQSWQHIEERGLCKGDLVLKDISPDPLDGTVAEFDVGGNRRMLKSLGAGVPVTVNRLDENENLKVVSSGHIVDSQNHCLKVCVYRDKDLNYDCSNYIVMPSANTRIIDFFKDVSKNPSSLSTNSTHLLNLAFRSVTMPSIHDRKIKSLPESLNESQKAAVSAALNPKRNFLCIQGPPGTGKTRVIAEIVHQLISKKKKVLVCAPTHVAVRNALEATKRRVDSSKAAEQLTLLKNIKDEFRDHPMMPKLLELSRFAKTDKAANAEYMKMYWKTWADICAPKLAIFSTISSSTVQKLSSYKWKADVLIVDEAAQCTEPATWIPLLTSPSCNRLVLVGDQKQLPAVILSDKGLENQLNMSLMEKLADEFASSNMNVLLKEQFRMNEKIMKWSNEVFYEDQLTAHPTVSNITLSEICTNLPEDHVLNNPIFMIDMDKVKVRTREETDNKSFINRDEIGVVTDYVQRLVIDLGMNPKDIAVIAPYYSQIEELRRSISFPVDVNTVDAFQGHERQVVIFCLVRDNQEGSIGFLRETRRLNVAITRAKRQFVLIGSAKMLRNNNHLRRLYKNLKEDKVIFGPEVLKTSEDVGLPNS